MLVDETCLKCFGGMISIIPHEWHWLSFFIVTACYLLYGVSHGWLCTFVLGVLAPKHFSTKEI